MLRRCLPISYGCTSVAAAYVLMHGLASRSGLRQLGLKGTEFARAQATTIRLRLLKIGARIRITVRKVWISMAAGFPPQTLFGQVWHALGLRCDQARRV